MTYIGLLYQDLIRSKSLLKNGELTPSTIATIQAADIEQL